jgi:hypothetical protein
METKKKTSNVLAVIILAIAVGYGISTNKDDNATSTNTSDIQASSPFKFTATAMKNSLESGGYEVHHERLKTLDAYVANHPIDKLNVRFDIYHARDNDQIDWVEIAIDASGYININKIDDPPNPKVIEAATKVASQAYKFPFFNKDSEEAAKLSDWVDSNVGNAIKQVEVIETKIGDLYFTMYGQPYIRFLEITTKPKE